MKMTGYWLGDAIDDLQEFLTVLQNERYIDQVDKTLKSADIELDLITAY